VPCERIAVTTFLVSTSSNPDAFALVSAPVVTAFEVGIFVAIVVSAAALEMRMFAMVLVLAVIIVVFAARTSQRWCRKHQRGRSYGHHDFQHHDLLTYSQKQVSSV